MGGNIAKNSNVGGLLQLMQTYELEIDNFPSNVATNLKRYYNSDTWSTIEPNLLKRTLIGVASQMTVPELKSSKGGGRDVLSLLTTPQTNSNLSSPLSPVGTTGNSSQNGSSVTNTPNPGSALTMPTVIDNDVEGMPSEIKTLCDQIESGDIPLYNVLLITRCLSCHLPNCIIIGIEIVNSYPCLYIYAKKRNVYEFASFRLLSANAKKKESVNKNIKRFFNCLWYVFELDKDITLFSTKVSGLGQSSNINLAAKRFWIIDSHEFGRGYYICENRTDISLKNLIREELENCVKIIDRMKIQMS